MIGERSLIRLHVPMRIFANAARYRIAAGPRHRDPFLHQGNPAPIKELVMKVVNWITAAAALACAQPVQAGINDPEIIIYRFPGVLDDGGATNVGEATVFHCTNFSGVDENIRFVTRNSAGSLQSNEVLQIAHLATRTASTHVNVPYATNLDLHTGLVSQGTTAIAATSINVICTAATIDAANPKATGVALRGIRFSPVPGSQE